MNKAPMNIPATIILSLILVELLSISVKELMVVGRESG